MNPITKTQIHLPHPRIVGEDVVYPQQWEVADEVTGLLQERERTPIVLMQFQSGKTLAITAIIYNFIKWCEARRKTFQVCVLCGLSQVDLALQTKRRLTCGRSDDGKKMTGAALHSLATNTGLINYPNELMDQGIFVHHNSPSLKQHPICDTQDLDERLVIIDEVHLGNVKSGNLDSFLRNCGVRISERTRCWSNKNGTKTSVVGVSATPFAHTILSANLGDRLGGVSLFKTVYREPGPGYNGIEKMLKNGRLRQVEPLFEGSGPSKFLKSSYPEFHAACKADGAGYLVVRAKGPQHTQLVNYFSQKRNRIRIREFDDDKKNLVELNNFLGQEPDEPTLVIIKDCMRAGITLRENYIRGWIESNSKQADSQTQAGIGRACGYNRTEQYPIHCDLKAARSVLAYYHGLHRGNLSVVPAGIMNRGVSPRRDKRRSVIIMSAPEARAEIKRIEAGMLAKGAKPRAKQNGFLQISTTKGNKTNNIADFILRGRMDSNTTFGYLVNEKSSEPAYAEDFERLITLYPDWHNMVVVYWWIIDTYKLDPTSHPTWKVVAMDHETEESWDLPDGINGLHRKRSALTPDSESPLRKV